MDEHARKITAPVLETLNGFDRGSVSVADIQVAVAAAAQALDNSNARLIELLNLLEEDLEEIRFATPVEQHPAAVRERSRAIRELLAAEG